MRFSLDHPRGCLRSAPPHTRRDILALLGAYADWMRKRCLQSDGTPDSRVFQVRSAARAGRGVLDLGQLGTALSGADFHHFDRFEPTFTIWTDFYHFDRFGADPGGIHVWGAAFSCSRLRLADVVLI